MYLCAGVCACAQVPAKVRGLRSPGGGAGFTGNFASLGLGVGN